MSEFVVLPEQQIAFVEGLVKSYPEIAGLQAYEYFRSDVASQKESFIHDSGYQLDLSYAALTEANLRNVAFPTQTTLEAMMPVSRDLKADSLFEAVAARYAEMSMLSAARRMNDNNLSDSERKEAEDWFVLTNEAIYGKPKKDVFTGLARKNILPQLEKTEKDLPNTSTLSNELKGLIGSLDQSDYVPFVIDSGVAGRIRKLVTERYGALLEHIDVDREYEVNEIRQALEVSLAKTGGIEFGWSVKVVPNSSAISVSAHQKQVEVGENRATISGKELRGRVLHEVGIHAGRSIKAEKAGWLSAQYGNEGYLDFEEALATALEDAYKGQIRESGVNYYLIAGLAYGLDNHHPRDLRGVYEIIWRYNALTAQSGAEDLTDESIMSAKNRAFKSCVRMFRGTTTTQPGVVYLKDLSYFNGQTAAWKVLKHVYTQANFDLLEAGKLDLTRPDHLAIAENIASSNRS